MPPGPVGLITQLSIIILVPPLIVMPLPPLALNPPLPLIIWQPTISEKLPDSNEIPSAPMAPEPESPLPPAPEIIVQFTIFN